MKTNPDDSAFAAAAMIEYSSGQARTLKADGLTTREFFASMALNKLARANRQPERLKVIAEICIAQADALISELNKQGDVG